MAYDKFVFPISQTVHYRFPTHTNNLVLDRAEAETSEVFVVVLEPGESAPLHQHDDTEQIFYVLRGSGELQIGSDPGQRFAVKPGDVVRIPPHTLHRIVCQSDRMEYLSIDCFLGGRPEHEPTWESHAQEICRANGWNIDQVRRLA